MSRSKLTHIIGFGMLLWGCQSPNTLEKGAPALSGEVQRLPENALNGIEKAEDLEVQLFAHEPMVRNPTAIDIDHKGRVWVMENVNYRPSANPDNIYQEGGDQIVILEDKDGDGEADTRKIFYQGKDIDGSMGICVLGNQVIVSCSPHIWVFTDEDGDDTADHKEILFTGMGGPQGDHNVHTVIYGPDNRLYFNFGNGAGKILDSEENPIQDRWGHEINASGNPYWGGMVLRCEMDGSNLEVLGHNFRNNYEVAIDSYGTVWQSDNDDDGNKSVRINYVMEYGNFGFLDEFTGAPWQVARSGMAEAIPDRHWHQNDPGVVPNVLITGAGSPCGMAVYEGGLLPRPYFGQLLHADAGPGALRAYMLTEQGAGYSATIHNMLTRTTDTWYRPTDICVAPDGSVFGADWYDPGVGGHWAGDYQRGRIYRLAPQKGRYQVPTADVSTPEGAYEALKSPNKATQFVAAQAFRDFGESGIPALEALFQDHNSHHRARALWLLAAVDISYIQTALDDPDPNLQLTAIRALRQQYPKQFIERVSNLTGDPEVTVRREIALGLREYQGPTAVDLWATLAQTYDGEDRWFLEALGIGATDKWDACMQAWHKAVGEAWREKAGKDLIWRSRAHSSFDRLLELLPDAQLPIAEQARYLRATDFHEVPNKDARLAALLPIERPQKETFQRMVLTHLSPEFVQSSPQVRQTVEELLPGIAGTEEYITLVSRLSLKQFSDELFGLVVENPLHELGVKAASAFIDLEGWEPIEQAVTGEDPTIQSAWVNVLGLLNRGEANELLQQVVMNDDVHLATRKLAIHALSKGYKSVWLLPGMLQEAELPDELKITTATYLLNAARPADRKLARETLEELAPEASTLASLDELVQRSGDIDAGQTHFQAYCSSCHQVGEAGINFGPNLSEIGSKLGKEALYGAIIQPSAGISHGFEGYKVQTKDGATYQGYILSENDQEVTMKLPGGVTQSISQDDITSKEMLTQSLMTAGLHSVLGEEALVDLVSYLETLKDPEAVASSGFNTQIEIEVKRN